MGNLLFNLRLFRNHFRIRYMREIFVKFLSKCCEIVGYLTLLFIVFSLVLGIIFTIYDYLPSGWFLYLIYIVLTVHIVIATYTNEQDFRVIMLIVLTIGVIMVNVNINISSNKLDLVLDNLHETTSSLLEEQCRQNLQIAKSEDKSQEVRTLLVNFYSLLERDAKKLTSIVVHHNSMSRIGLSQEIHSKVKEAREALVNTYAYILRLEYYYKYRIEYPNTFKHFKCSKTSKFHDEANSQIPHFGSFVHEVKGWVPHYTLKIFGSTLHQDYSRFLNNLKTHKKGIFELYITGVDHKKMNNETD